MKLARLAVCLFVLCWVSTFLLAQSDITTGAITGRVTEQSGAVLPGATVEAKNLDTNFSRATKTDASGRFTLVALPPGPYTVTVGGAAGFGTLVEEKLTLNVGQTLSLNPVMKVSSAKEQVVVSETAAAVDIAKTESSSTLDNLMISTVPVLGRKFEDMLTLTPGVSISQGPDGDEINFNGQRGIYNNISLDGGDYNNGFFGEQMGGQRAAIDITMDAVGEFQVVASGASAEFGRTAGGVVNVITKSGTNNLHGSVFEFFRNESLTSNTSDGKPLSGFKRNQFGGTLGGPVKKDKLFFFGAVEGIREDLNRANLGQQMGGTACPVATPTVQANEALINSNLDCQRLALLNYYKTQQNGDNEAQPIDHSVRNVATLGKIDWNATSKTKITLSYNFDYSNNANQTFDVASYGTSANGIEGPSKINAISLNGFTTISQNVLNEVHLGFTRENRPRSAVKSSIISDTAIGGSDGSTVFRFGHPFFLAPNVDEVFWRGQMRDNLTFVNGRHTVKTGAEWVHSRNGQVFRGFFQGYDIFGSAAGFIHYASPATLGSGYGPNAGQCADGSWTSSTCADQSTPSSPLYLYLQAAGLNGPATDAAGYSNVKNEDLAYFIQDKWQVRPNLTLSYGLRWEAQVLPDPVIDPSKTAYAQFIGNPKFPSNGKIPSQWNEWQPRLGLSWDVRNNQKSVVRASAGIYNAHQNMLSQVGSITTNGVTQQTISGNPTYLKLLSPTPVPAGTFPAGTGVRVFDKNYKNPRVYTGNFQYEQEVAKNTTIYTDITWSKGVYLTNFLDYNRADRGSPFGPALGETMVTGSRANSLYRGVTVGARRRVSKGLTFEGNYVYSQDWDNDSNERDPFTDLSPAVTPGGPLFNLRANYAPSNRDMRHKFNAYTFVTLPGKVDFNLRMQAHSAQPMYGLDGSRNSVRKDNQYASVDWRVSRAIKMGERYELIPTAEMFNTFNAANNVNTVTGPGLFNFDGFLRKGVGDPRQLQLAIKLKF